MLQLTKRCPNLVPTGGRILTGVAVPLLFKLITFRKLDRELLYFFPACRVLDKLHVKITYICWNVNANDSTFHKNIFVLLVQPQSCGDPGQVENARRSGFNFNVNGVVNYDCNQCYNGGGSITCQSNGQWSQRLSCRSKSLALSQNVSMKLYPQVMVEQTLRWNQGQSY